MSKKNENLTPEEINDAVETTKEASEEITAEPTECEKLDAELKSQKESYLRLAAEYDNYRKRTQQEKLSIYADATAKAIEELLPMSDSINAALSATAEDDPQRQGIELIGNQFAKCMEKLGVESFGEIGETFDPQLHNAVARTENPELGDNTIAMVFQKGFKIGDKIIRAAMVQVANCG